MAFGGGFGGGNNPFSGGSGGFGGGESSGNPFAGGGSGGFGGGEGENPFAGGDASSESGGFGGAPESDTNSDYDFGAFEQQSGEGDLDALIAQSPFGVLLDIPGIDGAEDIFGNVGGFGEGENPFAGGGAPDGESGGAGGMENPFANFNPLEEGNPFVEGDEPDVDFGGNTGAPSNIPEMGEYAVGSDDEGYLVRDEAGEWYVSEDDAISDDDTPLSNPDIPEVPGFEGAEGNPFGGDPGEFNPLEEVPAAMEMEEDMSGEMPEAPSSLYEWDFSAEDMNGEMPEAPSSLYEWDFSVFEDLMSGDDIPVELNDGVLEVPDGIEVPISSEDGEIAVGGGPVNLNEDGELEIPGFDNINLFNEEGETDPLLGNFAGGPGFGNVNIPELGEGSEQGQPGAVAPEFEDGALQIPGVGEIEVFDDEGNFALGVGGPQLGEDGTLQFAGFAGNDISFPVSGSETVA